MYEHVVTALRVGELREALAEASWLSPVPREVRVRPGRSVGPNE